MADTYEQNLGQKSSLTVNDYIRVVGSDNASYKQLVSDVAKKIIENYTGSSLAGSSQSVKSALDALNRNVEGTLSSSHTLLSGQCKLVKVGKVVTLTMGLQFTSAVGNYSVIATIPSGFRPIGQLWSSCRGFDFDVTAGGNIRAITSMPSGEYVNVSITYITA